MVFICPECGRGANQSSSSNSTLVAGNVVVRKKRCPNEHVFLTVEAVIDENATLTLDDIVIKSVKGDQNGHLRPDHPVQRGTASSTQSPQVAVESSFGHRERAEV